MNLSFFNQSFISTRPQKGISKSLQVSTKGNARLTLSLDCNNPLHSPSLGINVQGSSKCEKMYFLDYFPSKH
jgi:hypothetical protein